MHARRSKGVTISTSQTKPKPLDKFKKEWAKGLMTKIRELKRETILLERQLEGPKYLLTHKHFTKQQKRVLGLWFYDGLCNILILSASS